MINAAAYTAVDQAESERELAFAVNGDGAGGDGRGGRASGVPLVHISTDYVFDGARPAPYARGRPDRARSASTAPASSPASGRCAGGGARM